MKRRLKNALGKLLNTPINKIEHALMRYDVISFDIFDTLIKRNVNEERDVFYCIQDELVEKYGNDLSDFANNRIQIEKRLRQQVVSGKHDVQREEIILKDIYALLDDIYMANGYENIHLIDYEIQKELDLCVANKSIQALYNKALECGKKVIIVSDMYLDEKTIRCILDKCGYCGYSDLYLSASYDKTKYFGSLYEVIRKKYSEEKILHIGDNVKSDWYMAKKSGLDSLLVYKNIDHTIYWKSSKLIKNDSRKNYLELKKIISNVGEKLNPYQRIGYEILGPLLYGFCYYLHQEFVEKKFNKVFFFSRDGLIIQKVYNMLFPDDDIEQCYMYVSRLSVSMGLMSLAQDFDDILDVMKPFLHDTTLGFVGRLCNFDSDKYIEELKDNNLTSTDDIYSLEDEKKIAFYNIVLSIGGAYFEEQYIWLKEYLSQISFCGNIAVVDIGWNATSQKLLEKVLDVETKVSGYYVGVFNSFRIKDEKNSIRNGYLFSPGVNEEYYYMTRLTLLVYDLLFISTEGSTIGYKKKDGIIGPIFGEPDYHEESKRIVETIQSSALECVKVINACGGEIDGISPDIIMNAYYNFAVRPKLKTLALFDSIYLSDVDKIKLLPKHKMMYYLFHLKELKEEMKKNVCKVWFFKWLLKAPLPYYRLLKMMLSAGAKSDYMKETKS